MGTPFQDRAHRGDLHHFTPQTGVDARVVASQGGGLARLDHGTQHRHDTNANMQQPALGFHNVATQQHQHGMYTASPIGQPHFASPSSMQPSTIHHHAHASAPLPSYSIFNMPLAPQSASSFAQQQHLQNVQAQLLHAMPMQFPLHLGNAPFHSPAMPMPDAPHAFVHPHDTMSGAHAPDHAHVPPYQDGRTHSTAHVHQRQSPATLQTPIGLEHRPSMRAMPKTSNMDSKSTTFGTSTRTRSKLSSRRRHALDMRFSKAPDLWLDAAIIIQRMARRQFGWPQWSGEVLSASSESSDADDGPVRSTGRQRGLSGRRR